MNHARFIVFDVETPNRYNDRISGIGRIRLHGVNIRVISGIRIGFKYAEKALLRGMILEMIYLAKGICKSK